MRRRERENRKKLLLGELKKRRELSGGRRMIYEREREIFLKEKRDIGKEREKERKRERIECSKAHNTCSGRGEQTTTT